MEHAQAQRRLVKSVPELWAELSSEESLGRHLAPFGEIRITRVRPETTVAWEGDRASGTVEISPAGWGTKVTLTATPAAEPSEPDRAPGGLFARLLRRPAAPPDCISAPDPVAPTIAGPAEPPPAAAEAELEPAPPALDPKRTVAILGEVLDDLGGATHRPFSRG